MTLTPQSGLCSSLSWELQSRNRGATENIGLNWFFSPFKRPVCLCD